MSHADRSAGDPGAALQAWLERIEALHPTKIDLSLDRAATVLRALDLDQPPFRVLSIGGTNGKGSCVAMLEAIYRRAGYRVAAYTSPHLWRFNERIRIDGRDAADRDLLTSFEAIEGARGATTLSYFEFTTIAACLHFARAGVDVALLEVGLGGRLDAVNAVEPDLALVASIGIDHERWLGSTREAVGYEKAGIFRRARPAILGDRDPPSSVTTQAALIGADLWRAGTDFDFERHADGHWTYRGRSLYLEDMPAPPLRGDVQYANAASCLAAVEALHDRLAVDVTAIGEALAGAELRGRLETHIYRDLEWLFDVAHNPAAAAALARELGQRPATRTRAIVGIMADKDMPGVLGPLAPYVDEWIITRADSERAAELGALAETLAALTTVPVHRAERPAAAAALALSLARPGERVLVFGSFQIVGPAMAALELYSVPSLSGKLSAKWTGV